MGAIFVCVCHEKELRLDYTRHEPPTTSWHRPMSLPVRCRPWLDLGDIVYRLGAGYFHVAAKAYEGALQRGEGRLSPDQQVIK